MKRNILTSLLLIAALSFTASAKDNKQKADKKDNGKEEMRKHSEGKPQFPNPFEGLNLTDAQKEALKALAPNKEMKRANKEAKKEALKSLKEERKAQKKEFLAKIKSILTPEQYVQFLENSFLNCNKPDKMRHHPKNKSHFRHGDRHGFPPAPQQGQERAE